MILFRINMNKFSFLLILAIPIFGYAQPKSWFEANKPYFDLINKAEFEIMESDFVTSHRYYSEAFEKYQSSYADDYFNALVISIKVSDETLAYVCANRLAEMGICLEFCEAQPFLKQHKVKWEELIAKVANPKQEKNEYRGIIEQMLNDDQDIRMDKSYTLEKLKNLDSIRYVDFRELIDKYGFPSAEKIGIKCSSSNRDIHPNPADILMNHFTRWQFPGIDTILVNALASGDLHPNEYAQFASQCLALSIYYYNDPIAIMGNEFYVVNLNDSIKAEVDISRQKIGLPSFDQQIEKIRYNWINRKNGSEFKFRINGYATVIPHSPEMLQDSTLVKIDFDRN